MSKKLTDYTITSRIVVDPSGNEPEMSDMEVAQVSDWLGKRLDAEFKKVFGWGPPIFPTYIEEQPKPTCGCYIFHRGNCPLGLT